MLDGEKDLGVPTKCINRILKKHVFHPYLYRIVYSLKNTDYEKRVHFSEFFLLKCQEDGSFPRKVIWCDEAKNGLANPHNSHYWSQVNLHLTKQWQFQERWNFNVFCAIRDNQIIALHFYNENLNGERYVEILRNLKGNYLDRLHPEQVSTLFFVHDGDPANCGAQVNHFLEETFEDRWCANYGPHRWPSRLPDLTPLDFFIWGYVKNEVYFCPLTTKEDCQQRVRYTFNSLDPSRIRRATKRITKCLEVEGRNFEQFF